MADRFIVRNGVRKVIDGDNPAIVTTAREKGWAFEDESEPAPVAEAPAELEPTSFIRMQRGDQVKDVAPDLLETARGKGWAEVPTERVDYVQPGDVAEPTDAERAQATAQGFLKGAALGTNTVQDYAGAVSDQVMDWFDSRRSNSFQESLDMARANREGVAKKAPGNALLGEIAGTTASALAPGGAANLAGRLGTAVTARVAPRVATTLLGRTLAAGAGLVAEGAAYDAAEGAAGEIDKAIADGDWKGAAERLPASVLDGAARGAFWNVVGGAAVETVSRGVKLGLKAFRKGAQEAVEAADDTLVQAIDAKRIDDEAADALRAAETRELESVRVKLDATEATDALETKALTELEQNLEAAKPKALPEPTDDATRYVQAYEGHKSFRSHADESVSKLKAALDVLEENAEYADTHLALAAKNRVIRDAENGYGQAIKDPEVTGMLDRFGETLRAQAETALDEPTAKKLTGLANMADRAKALVNKNLTAGDVGDAFDVLDQMKRETGKLAASNKRGPLRDAARGQYDVLKNFLEREELFGEAAKIQKPFNAVWAPEITAETADALSGMWGRSGTASTIDPFIRSERVKASWLQSHLKNVGNDSDADSALRQYIATKTASQSVRADLLADAAGLERAAKSREAALQALKILDDNARLKSGAREWAGLSEDLQAGQLIGQSNVAKNLAAKAIGGTVGAVAGSFVSPVAGSVAGGTVGASLGDAIARRFTKTQLARDLERAAVQAEKNAIGRKVAAEKAANAIRAAEKRKSRAVLKAAGRDSWTGKVERAVQQAVPTVRAGVRKTLVELDREQEAGAPGPLSSLAPVLGPELTEAYAQQRAARNAFLLEKAGPPPVATPFGTAERVLSDEDTDRLARYIDAADDHTAALERLADRTATSEDLETLRTLYPSELNDFRGRVMAAVTKRKTPLPFDQQLALSESLGMDATLPQLSPESSAFWSGIAQASKTTGQQKAAPRGVKADLPGAQGASRGDRIG